MTRVFWKAALVVALVCPVMARADDSKTTPAKSDTAKPAPKATDSPNPDMKKDSKGRLPPYYAKLVDETQREAIYKIEGEYSPKIKDLYAQLKTLTDERDQKIRAVLTADQQKKLDDMVASAKNGKKRGGDKTEPKSTKPDAGKPDTAKPDGTVPAKPAATPVLTK
jgi:hypothetical protein